MASNPYVNKVELANGTTLIDLTSDTVAADKMVSGYTAHDASGASVTGSIPVKIWSDISQAEEARFYAVTTPAGYYASDVVSQVEFSGPINVVSYYNPFTGTLTVTSKIEKAGYAKTKQTTSTINVPQYVYTVGSYWATEDGTKDPATELGFGTWTRVSPIEATWNRLKQTTSWASMQMDAPTVYVWKRTA